MGHVPTPPRPTVAVVEGWPVHFASRQLLQVHVMDLRWGQGAQHVRRGGLWWLPTGATASLTGKNTGRRGRQGWHGIGHWHAYTPPPPLHCARCMRQDTVDYSERPGAQHATEALMPQSAALEGVVVRCGRMLLETVPSEEAHGKPLWRALPNACGWSPEAFG